MDTTFRAALFAGLMLLAPAVQAADPCQSFKWDVGREVKLFAGPGTSLAAGRSADDAPVISTGRLYVLGLQPQATLQFPVPPSKKMLTDGAFGGVLRFEVPAAGSWRVAIDSGFWLDIVQDAKALPAADFHGSADCPGPRKVVLYELPAATALTLQLGAASAAEARLSVTPVAPPAP